MSSQSSTPPVDTGRYLARIGYQGPLDQTVDTLEALQRAHMTAVPFENLDVYRRVRVHPSTDWSLPKIVDHGRGGWCFENNGAFAALLEALGFRVARLGAAVLLGGPNQVIDHLTLEVTLDEPWLVDVGFGDSFVRPLRLNQSGAQDGGTGTYEFIDSSQGLTLTCHDDQQQPLPQFRFRRVTHTMADFEPASARLQDDRELHWSQKPFATRLLEGGPGRVTLLGDRLKLRPGASDSEEEVTPVSAADWNHTLAEWFDMTLPKPLEP